MSATPGPWAVRFHENIRTHEVMSVGEQKGSIAHVDPFNLDAEANARLIAAAPALLEALKEAQEALDVLAGDADEAGYPARAESATAAAMKYRTLIAHAEGR